jgi:hypothetical protein
LGGFDEELVRNQDDELNLRIWRAGGSVWQSKDIRSFYSPRSSPSALFSQFYQYGYWKVPVIMKHRRPGSARHLAPFVLVGSVTLLALLGFVWPVMAAAGVSVALVYGIALFAAARSTPKPRHIGLVMFALACMHIGYGVGFGHGLLDWVILRRAPGSAVTRLTR